MKTPGKKPPDDRMELACYAADKKSFREAARREGFTTLTGWALYHLRRIAKETLRAE